MPDTRYITTIGLEVHVQLNTISKLFCADSTEFGQEQNSQVGVVSLAYPGALPVLNERAVELALRLAIATKSEIADVMMFDRKNYFYPDLPKGYQITQDRAPIARGGFVPVEVDGTIFEVNLTKMHLEEDAGKSIHDISETHTLIDYNRAGVPLVEVVTEPIFSNGKQVAEFLATMRRLVRYLGVSDANMEEGSLRCDVNISLRREGEVELGNKAEIKNLNSIRFVQKAIGYEQERQELLLNAGEEVIQETRLFDPESGTTRSMRMKETLTDYRYFPDPDLPAFVLAKEMVDNVREKMPFVPWEIKDQLVNKYGLPTYDAEVLTEEREIAEFYLELADSTGLAKACSNWIMGPVKGYLNESRSNIRSFPLSIGQLGKVISLVESGAIPNSSASKILFPALLEKPGENVEDLAIELGLIGSDDDEKELSDLIDVLWDEYPNEASEFAGGKKKLLGMFMGEVMKRTGGKADPGVVRNLLFKKID